jgi:signal transduction histidine kinase
MRGGATGGLTLKAALLLGFGLTLGLWLFTGYQLTRRISALERDATAANARYTKAQELLSTIRAQALLGSVYVRDALLDPDPSSVELYRGRLERVYTEIDRALQQYVPVTNSPGERRRADDFRREIGAFRATILDVLATDRNRWSTDARALLDTRVMPKREAVIRLSDDAQTLNRRSFVEQQAGLATIYAAAERQMWVRLGVALAASLAIGLLATLYAARLENRLTLQLERDHRNTRDLQRLSAKLITAQEEERRTIARELHDEVGQVLTAINVELSLAKRALDGHGAPTTSLDTAQAITNGALHTVRDLSRLLHPSILDDLGLPAALTAYIGGFKTRHALDVSLHMDGMEQRLAPQMEATLYRIVQEALTNVVRHADASACRVSLQRTADTVLLTIEDDGRGFDPENDRRKEPRGLGLIGIRERVSHLRGTVTLSRSPEGGARLSVDVPASGITPEVAHG